MSQLIEKLNRVSQTVPQPMGFKTVKTTSSKPKMVLVASLSQANLNNLADYMSGADGGLLTVSTASGAEDLQAASQAAPGIPWGTRLEDGSQATIDKIVKAGGDFIVFAAASSLSDIPQNNTVGKILEVEVSLSDGLLRAVDSLPVDAVLTAIEPEAGYSLTWHHLMSIQRFTAFLTKPLLVSVPSSISANEINALWEAGVDGILVTMTGEQPTGRTGELRQIIDKLPTPSHRKRGRVEPLLPRIAPQRDDIAEEEEEDE